MKRIYECVGVDVGWKGGDGRGERGGDEDDSRHLLHPDEVPASCFHSLVMDC